MKAIQVQGRGEESRLFWGEAPDPVMGQDDVLVDVQATSVNRADLSQRAGHYAPPPGASEILGLDVAGTVAALGANVSGAAVGDRVCALVPGGGYAERAVVPAAMLMPVPPKWSFAEAAALPEAHLTAFLNIFLEAGYREGETVLIHGGASGVGTAAVQLVRAAGGHALATAGSTEKVRHCLAAGAELAVNYREEDFAARVREHAGGVDVILDMVGGPYLEANIGLLKLKGRLVFISTLGGGRAELNIGALLGRRLRLIGSLLRSRTPAEKAAIRDAFMERFWLLLESRKIVPVIDAVYPIEEAERAHRRIAENANIGKIVLEIKKEKPR